jgi:uncharacterized membrane protein required for colicin V production
MLNALDYFIIATFLAVIAVGFFNGVTRVTSAILAIYFASIVSAAFYRTVSDVAREHLTTMNKSTSNLFFFIVLFIIFATSFTIIISHWLGGLKLPRRIEIIDNVGGAALGVLVSGLAVTLAAMLLIILLQALNQTFGPSNGGTMVGMAHDQIEGSTLVPVFMRMSPHFVRLISPWFPNGLPPILSVGVEA